MIMLPARPRSGGSQQLPLSSAGRSTARHRPMLTEHDLKYRINAAEIKMVITSMDQADKIDAIAKDCPSLTCRFMVDGKREHWISYPVELDYPAPVSAKLVNLPGMKKTKATDPMVNLLYLGHHWRSKDGAHCQSYALGHIVTSRFWHDVHEKRPPLHLLRHRLGKERVGQSSTARGSRAPQSSYTISAAGSMQPNSCRSSSGTGISTFCCPPTIYRMLILADLDKFDFTELRHCVSAGRAAQPRGHQGMEGCNRADHLRGLRPDRDGALDRARSPA